MKIGFCGKGGSGKSTVLALVAAQMQAYGKKVLIIDSDESNAGLHRMLGIENPPAPLMDFIGGKKWAQQEMISRITTGTEETDVSLLRQKVISSAAVPDEYISGKDRCRIVMIGKIEAPLEGCACPMGAVTKEFLRKFEVGKDEVVLVDLEAGLEHFGRGIEEGLDKMIAVVEPSQASILLAKQIEALCKRMDVCFAGAVINRFANRSEKEIMKEALQNHGVEVAGELSYQKDLAMAGLKGQTLNRLKYDEVSQLTDRILGNFKNPDPGKATHHLD